MKEKLKKESGVKTEKCKKWKKKKNTLKLKNIWVLIFFLQQIRTILFSSLPLRCYIKPFSSSFNRYLQIQKICPFLVLSKQFYLMFPTFDLFLWPNKSVLLFLQILTFSQSILPICRFHYSYIVVHTILLLQLLYTKSIYHVGF